MSLSYLTIARPRISLARLTVLALVTAGVSMTGAPAFAVASTTTITGTVSFHETNPERIVEVYREVSGTWTEDESLETTVATNGAYTIQTPAGEAVRLRTSYGDHDYGYWYGDGFEAQTAVSVQGAAGSTVSNIDLDVPAPSWVTGRVTDRSGRGIVSKVVPAVNNDGGLRPLTSAPIETPASGEYTVILPAAYETGILGVALDGSASDWLGGGSMAEPNFYINTTPGEQRVAIDLVLPISSSSGSSAPTTSATPAPKPAASTAPAGGATRLTATDAPAVRGAAKRGATLRATAGRWNLTPTTVRFQWLRNGAVIRHATASAYRIKRADVRKRISVRVTVARSGISSKATALSARSAVVRAR